MGTRSTVKFYDGDSVDPILSVYQQFDGYIEGVGHDLANWLISKKMINGFGGQTMEQGFANGMWCLVAQYVAKHKTEIGKFYMTYSDDVQEYNYEVRYKNNKFEIKVWSENKNTFFIGSPNELLNFKEKEEQYDTI